MYSGEVRQVEFSLTDADVSPEVPLDLTGLTVKWGASRVSSSGSFSTSPLFQKCSNLSSPNQITITNVTGGQGNFTINPADTSGISSGDLRHQMVVESADGPVLVLEGTITISRRIVQTC